LCFNQQVAYAINTRKNKSMGLATRSRASSRLMAYVGSVMAHNSKGKLVVDLTGEPARPFVILGGGPVCYWSPPHGGSIIFKVAS
jgi:hypothetical protein